MPADAFTLRALPYFFNATRAGRLSLLWSVNGESVPAENPSQLALNPSEHPAPVAVQLTAKNPFSALGFEVASTELDLQ